LTLNGHLERKIPFPSLIDNGIRRLPKGTPETRIYSRILRDLCPNEALVERVARSLEAPVLAGSIRPVDAFDEI